MTEPDSTSRSHLGVNLKSAAKQPEGESPQFIQPLKSQEVVEGSPVKLEVRISGEPEPDVEWFKDEQPIKDEGNFRIELDDSDGCTLIINSARHDDEGVYRCVASNDFGEAVSEAELVVTGMSLPNQITPFGCYSIEYLHSKLPFIEA